MAKTFEDCSRSEEQWCSQIARKKNEPCLGTAPKVEVWCLLEYTGRWNSDAVRESALPPSVLSWLAQAQRGQPALRVQFIKQHDQPLQSITCFFAVTREQRRALYQFTFSTYEALLQIDLDALIRGDASYAAFLVQEPVFLICTHGKHDRCCAKFGLPVYQAAARQVGSRAWQTSHVGGDKFAANLVCLPLGIYYGQMTPAEVSKVIVAAQNDHLLLERYRGRSCSTAVVQAAEFFLRQATGLLDLQSFSLNRIEMESERICRITFLHERNGGCSLLTMRVDPTTVSEYSVCDGLQTETVNYYRLLEYAFLEAEAWEDHLLKGHLGGETLLPLSAPRPWKQ